MPPAPPPRRTAGAALRAQLSIAAALQLTPDEDLAATGFPDPASLATARRAASDQGSPTIPDEALVRLGVTLSTYASLTLLYRAPAEVVSWLRGPHGAAPFGGRRPIELVCGNLEEAEAALVFLKAAETGVYMPPGLNEPPLTDADIVFGSGEPQ